MIKYCFLLICLSSFKLIVNDEYCNARFNYCIVYPSGLMKPAAESANGDGCIFYTPGKKEILRVYGSLAFDANGNELTLSQQYQIELKRFTKTDSIQYKRLSKSFFVISGTSKGNIFYEKVIIKEDAFAFAKMIYSKVEKDKVEKVLPAIFASFH